MTTIEIKLIKEQVSKLDISETDLLTYRNRLKPYTTDFDACIDSEGLDVYNTIAAKLPLPTLIKEMSWLTGAQ